MNRIAFLIFLAGLVLLPAEASAQESIKGQWFTDRDQALQAAKKARKPILAAAMDHA